MAMTMEQRIEAAAKAGYITVQRLGHFPHTIDYRSDMREILSAAFPELFDGTAWLAPMELTPAMEDAWCRRPSDEYDADADWAAMRNAHLSPETDAKVEG